MSDKCYNVVAFGAYRIGVEVIGNYPHADWLAGWLRDEVVKRKVVLTPEKEARWLAERINDSQPDRDYFVELQRSGGLGYVRVEGHSTPTALLRQ